MRTRTLSASATFGCGLALLGSVALGCDAPVHALGSSEQGLSTEYPNPSVCPEAPTEAMLSYDSGGDFSASSTCSDVPAGTICAYDVRDVDGAYNGWAGYVCGCTVEGHWKNVGTNTGGVACPELAPDEGAACDPVPGSCPYYPDHFAVCTAAGWHYEPGPRYPCDLLGKIVP